MNLKQKVQSSTPDKNSVPTGEGEVVNMFMQRSVIAALLLLLYAGAAFAAGKETRKVSAQKKDSKSGTTQKKDAKMPSVPKSDATEVGKVGRYQLLSVEYASNDLINETSSAKKELILLDTATGKMKVCMQKNWLNVADGKEISERKCLPFETYGEYPVGTLKMRKSREAELVRP